MKLRIGLLGLVLIALLAACDLNRPPQATLDAKGLLLSVSLNWLASDPDGDALRCTLDFGDGTRTSFAYCPREKTLTHTYTQAGRYTITLTVTDSGGRQTTAQRVVDLPTRPSDACPAPTGTASLALEPDPVGLGFADGAATVPGRLAVRLAEVSVQSVEARIAALGARTLARPAAGWLVLEVPEGQERATAETLVAEGLARYAQPVYHYKLVATPNDPYFPTYQSSQFDQMSLTQGWDLLRTDACRPIAAVVDSGADLEHPDLTPNLLPGYDFSDDDDDPSDEDGHGTMVAGIIGAATNNNTGVAGSTQNLAYVLPVKVFPNATSDVIAEGIHWAADAGAHLVNLSLCIVDSSGHCADLTNSPDALIEDALKYATQKGVIALAASGNDGYNYVGYPASSAYTIAVGSVDSSNTRSSFSNYGDALDFVAPGEAVASTAPAPDYYLQGSGTSFATPYVTGITALYIGQYYAIQGALPNLSQTLTCFQNNSAPATPSSETGFGVPQADLVLDPADGTCYP